MRLASVLLRSRHAQVIPLSGIGDDRNRLAGSEPRNTEGDKARGFKPEDVVRFPRFRRHLTWRDNAPGGENDDEEKTTVYGRVQV